MATEEDPAKPLKKYLAERISECLGSMESLVKDVSYVSRGSTQTVEKTAAALVSKEATMVSTREILQRMPDVLSGLDVQMDAVLQRVCLLSLMQTQPGDMNCCGSELKPLEVGEASPPVPPPS
eukprot:TRINITY_DN3207_c0_g1_i1.p1 TRINITY_DN3207_c0_g1~~TRINITY_DN3207_c0_g1_i1.p1  ORF type:complete len:123 (+),score=21.58 TRINITY_DN3207_c0_g1_i1:56-424(+)